MKTKQDIRLRLRNLTTLALLTEQRTITEYLSKTRKHNNRGLDSYIQSVNRTNAIKQLYDYYAKL